MIDLEFASAKQALEGGSVRPLSPVERVLPYLGLFLIVATTLGFLVGVGLIFPKFGIRPQDMLHTQAVGILLVQALLLIVTMDSRALYSSAWKRTFREELRELAAGALTAAVITTLLLFFVKANWYLFACAVSTAVVGCFAMVSWRRFLSSQCIPGMTDKKNVVIIGAGQLADEVRKHIEETPELGFVFCGYIDRSSGPRQGNSPDYEFLGTIDELPAIIRSHFIDEIFICVPGDRQLVSQVSGYARAAKVGLRIVPQVLEHQSRDVPIDYVGSFPTLNLQHP